MYCVLVECSRLDVFTSHIIVNWLGFTWIVCCVNGTMASKRATKTSGKKHQLITVAVKKDIIAKHEGGLRVTDLAAEYSMATSTICTILKNKIVVIKAADVATGVKQSWASIGPVPKSRSRSCSCCGSKGESNRLVLVESVIVMTVGLLASQ